MIGRALMLRSLTRQAQQQQPRVQRATALLACRPANCRAITTSRARLAAEKPPASGSTSEAGRAQDALVLTPYEKVTATAQSGFWLGLLGLGVVGCYFVIKELMPNRMSANGLFSESLDLVSDNSEVTSRIGTPIHGYGQDRGGHREGRRNHVEHVNLKDKDGNPRLRIKYNIKGPTGAHAYVFAEVNHDMKKGEYVYLIAQFTKNDEVIKLIDNRQILAAGSKEEQDALRQLLGGGQ